MQNIFNGNYNSCYQNEYEKRGCPHTPKNKKKKKDFKTLKKNTIHSLNDVEYFLNNLSQIFRGVKIYKLIKK